jgi:thiamine biosynthesis protein ThiI
MRGVAVFLVRYGETGLKGPPVRRRFEQMLSENIVRAHSLAKVSCIVEKERGRLFVTAGDQEVSSGILSRTFGVVSHSLAEERSSRREDIAEAAVSRLSKVISDNSTFAVRARRVGTHSYTSMELAAYIGEKVLEAFGGRGVKVDLDDPDIELFVEVRNNRSYLFDRVLGGPGGLPLRTQGKVLAVVDDRKSLLAAWLVMRRGCSAVLLNRGGLKEDEIELLRPWNPWWTGHIEGMEPADLLKLKKCSGLVLGWNLDEFNSREKPDIGVPVFYPLIGMPPAEVEIRMREVFG